MPGYELAARSVLRAVGIQVELVQEPLCCGAPIAESFTEDWVYLSAYNLARVRAMGRDTVLTLCGSCTNALTRARLALQDKEVREEAARRLAPLGLEVADDVEPKHLVRLLSEREDELRTQLVRPLDIRVAITNPCQAFRPSDVMQFDDGMEPQSMRRLIELTGAEIVPYGGEDECCGATLFLADPRLSLAAGRRKLEATREAEVLVHSCGNCHLLLRHLQHRMFADDPELRARARKRALFLPQLVGLSMGLAEAELGLREGVWGRSR
jgi:heterodisulfide reductase subunit B